MSKSNILKHLQPPEGQCRKEWERILSRDLIETGCDWLHWFYSSKVGGNQVGDAVSALCDRCEALEQENARLKELIRDTPFVADMSVIVFSASLPRMETDESKEIAEWLERRKELLND